MRLARKKSTTADRIRAGFRDRGVALGAVDDGVR